MPEGDTIFRTARTLHRAIGGRVVTRFDSVLPHLMRIDADRPLRGRTISRVESRGKHVLIWFSGDLVLRTHMRMHGSWHIYRPGERWQRPHADMRVVIETEVMHAVAFSVPVAELASAEAITRSPALADLGPDLLAPDFDTTDAVARLAARSGTAIADALLDQSALAGIGNVYKSEVLFAAGVSPFADVATIDAATLTRIVRVAHRLLHANVSEGRADGGLSAAGARRTTGRLDPAARLWVYERGGQPCRRCGTRIERRAQGPHARSTYWCPRCQSHGAPAAFVL
jgi:endonuclease-8